MKQKKLEIKYFVKGEEKDSLFTEFKPFERLVSADELASMLKDIRVIVYSAERRTREVEGEVDDWTVMK